MRVFSLGPAAAAALAALPQTRVRRVLVLPVFLCFNWYRKAGSAF